MKCREGWKLLSAVRKVEGAIVRPYHENVVYVSC